MVVFLGTPVMDSLCSFDTGMYNISLDPNLYLQALLDSSHISRGLRRQPLANVQPWSGKQEQTKPNFVQALEGALQVLLGEPDSLTGVDVSYQ